MIKIIDRKQEVKKYTAAINEMFRLYRLNEKLSDNAEISLRFSGVINAMKSNNIYGDDMLKKEIFDNHLLGGEPLTILAERLNFSTSYVYLLHQTLIKDFAMIVFEVILL